MSAALTIFVLSYLVIATGRVPVLRLDRVAGAALGALAIVLAGVVSPDEAIGKGINHDTLLLLLGMMVISACMAEAQLFRYASWLTLTHVHSRRGLLIALVFVAGGISTVLVNDTVCVMFTPLVLQLIEDAALPPLPFLLALAFGANAGSVATPTGNPQNMIVATLSGISYLQFVKTLLLPALASLLLVAGVLLVLFRRDLHSGAAIQPRLERPPLQQGLALLSLVVLAGVVVAFLCGFSMPWTALTGAGALLLLGRRPSSRLLVKVDWPLLVFFGGLFIITYGVGKARIAEAFFDGLRGSFGSGPLVQAGLFGIFTVIASQVVSNVPFVLLAAHWMQEFANPHLMWLSTALFSTLAGNLTTVGSVANLIVLEGARRHQRVGFFQFFRYGAPVTIATLAGAYGVLVIEALLGM